MLEFYWYTAWGKPRCRIVANHPLHAQLVKIVGCLRQDGAINVASQVEFICGKDQADTIKLLYENGFKGMSHHSSTLVYRPNNKPITVEKALEAIKRGDYIVENFLQQLDS